MWIALIVTVGFFLLTQLMLPSQKAKAGTFDEFDFPRVADGSPVYYIAGRVKVESPNLLWYGDFSSSPIRKKSGLFSKSTVGYKYFLGFQLGVCLGPDVKLLAIWFGGEDPVWTSTGGSGGGGGGPVDRIRVWKDSEYRSKMLGFNAAVPDLKNIGLNDGISSIRTTDAWEVFVHANYSGESMVVDGDYPNLAGTPFQDSISSLRPIASGGGGGGGGGSGGGGSGSTLRINIADPDAFGGETGGGGYDLELTFYPGSGTQSADPYLRRHLGRVPGWRGLSYVVANGYIGNTTNLQAMAFEVERVPDPLGLGAKAVIGTEGDVNPANVIYEMLTNNFGALGIHPSKMNVASFVQAGNIFFDEDEGISVGFGGSTGQIKDAFADILRQVDATMYEDPLDGEVYLKLLRADYDVDTLPELNESTVISVASYAINLWSDTKNKVRVVYTDRSRDYKNDAVAVAEDMANIAFQNNVIKPVTSEYPHIKRSAHAARKATRDLTIFSTPLANIRLTSLRFEMGLRPGSAVKMAYGDYNIRQLVLRVKSVSLGSLDDNKLVIELAADKHAQSLTIYGVPGPSLFERPSLSALPITVAKVMEAPLWFVRLQSDVVDAEAPRVMALPQKPASTQQSYRLFAAVSGEAHFDEIDSEVAYPAYGTLQSAYPQSYSYDTAGGIELADIDNVPALTSATRDQIVSEGVNLILVNNEVMAFESYEMNAAGRYVLKGIRRGLLDTVPAAHIAGSRVIWLGADFVGTREFEDGDQVEVILASVAPRGGQSEAAGVTLPVPGVIP